MAETVAPAEIPSNLVLRKMRNNNDSKKKKSLAVRLRSRFGKLTGFRDDQSIEEQGKKNVSSAATSIATVSRPEGKDVPLYIDTEKEDYPTKSNTTANSRYTQNVAVSPPIIREENVSSKNIDKPTTCHKCGRHELLPRNNTNTPSKYPSYTCPTCRPTLLSLPLELLQLIPSHLDNASTWLLRLSCTYLYTSLATTPNPRHDQDSMIFMLQLRTLIPACLEYCPECNIYHAWNATIWYWWDDEKRCRRYAMADGVPSFRGGILGKGFYVCETCNSRQEYEHCALCTRCYDCSAASYGAGAKELERGYVGVFYCRLCSVRKIRCCGRPILARKACHGCGRCEGCTECRFRDAQTLCGLCRGR
ncbi:hypothetical protein CC86DRAFT_161636 [Ophiobolus disseminans]|uniref:F-box domain-containing protein n=1 Tax=Ophiobolus disseminans TaxID=1469910 RepID=A0A6A7AC54_9PLEO|nr:hypothetical protein CC86DRAFT_161636 [Ophiobolus disseminans]